VDDEPEQGASATEAAVVEEEEEEEAKESAPQDASAKDAPVVEEEEEAHQEISLAPLVPTPSDAPIPSESQHTTPPPTPGSESRHGGRVAPVAASKRVQNIPTVEHGQTRQGKCECALRQPLNRPGQPRTNLLSVFLLSHVICFVFQRL
jgi:hypothetical protein